MITQPGRKDGARVHDTKLQVSWPLWKLATMRTSWCHNPAAGKLTVDTGFTTLFRGGLHACAMLTVSGIPQRPPPSFTWQYAVAHVRGLCCGAAGGVDG